MPRAAMAIMRPSWPPPKMPMVAPGKIGRAVVRPAGLLRSSVHPAQHGGVFFDRFGKHLVARWPRAGPRASRAGPGSVVASMATASKAALAAPLEPIASVPTGTPRGICTMLSRASKPCSAVARNGHAEHRHHRKRRKHAGQVRRAARPGNDAAQTTARRLPGKAYHQVGRAMCAHHAPPREAHPNSLRISSAAPIAERSLFDPITTATSGARSFDTASMAPIIPGPQTPPPAATLWSRGLRSGTPQRHPRSRRGPP